jgi:hypothetical protein
MIHRVGISISKVSLVVIGCVMINARGITVCVNYDDLLAITLPKNALHLREVFVVTTPNDYKTQEVVASVPNARCYLTDSFYKYGAKFNKGLALEEGFEQMGRCEWILSFDADTLFPEYMPLEPVFGKLYTPKRRLLLDPTKYTDSLDWASLPLSNDRHWPGYYQLFHADDPVIAEQPWMDVSFTHAGGGDGYFQSRWHPTNKLRCNFEVLHLGPRDTNWMGRVSPRVDGLTSEQAQQHKQEMERFLRSKGWNYPKSGENYIETVPGAKPKTWVH